MAGNRGVFRTVPHVVSGPFASWAIGEELAEVVAATVRDRRPELVERELVARRTWGFPDKRRLGSELMGEGHSVLAAILEQGP